MRRSSCAYNTLVNGISFPGEVKIPHVKRARRESLACGTVNNTFKRNIAAVEIQRVWRGSRVRRKIYQALLSSGALENKTPARQRLEHRHSEYVRSQSPTSTKTHRMSRRLSAYSNGGDSPQVSTHQMVISSRYISLPDPIMSFEEFCVSFIQNWWFKKRAEKTSLYVLSEEGAEMAKTREKAASCIQKAWRRHIDIQVYHYYRDLIQFYSKGDPKLMLKCINPKEADLLDYASGIHIRFRLAGEKFPPNIYYKIYTHRPVADINSFAPRDYTSPAWAAPTATIANSKIKNPNKTEDLSTWYQRQENNGWRLVSDRIFSNNDTDALILESSKERKFFHFSKYKRKKDIEAKRRQKKIQWMKSMYKEGREGKSEPDIADIADQDLEDMVEWCQDLNFDNYINHWLELATATTFPAGASAALPGESTLGVGSQSVC